MRDVLNVDPRAPSETKPTKRERKSPTWILMSGIKVRVVGCAMIKTITLEPNALPHLIVAVKRYSLRWIWFSRVKFIVTRTLTILFVTFFLSFFPLVFSRVKKKKKRRIKLEKLRGEREA